MDIQLSRLAHIIVIMMAFWKLNLLKCQMLLLEIIIRH